MADASFSCMSRASFSPLLRVSATLAAFFLARHSIATADLNATSQQEKTICIRPLRAASPGRCYLENPTMRTKSKVVPLYFRSWLSRVQLAIPMTCSCPPGAHHTQWDASDSLKTSCTEYCWLHMIILERWPTFLFGVCSRCVFRAHRGVHLNKEI